MDFSIRLRTADDVLAEKRTELKAIVTSPTSAPDPRHAQWRREPTVVVRRGAKLIRVPVSQVSQLADGA
jgi:hypothetical protein